MLDRLGAGRVECTECDIVGSRLTRFHRKVAAVVTSDANLHVLAQHLPGFARVAVVLTEVNPVRPQTLRKTDAVIHDERRIAIRAYPLERLGRPGDRVIIQPLQPQLERRDRSCIQRGFQPVGEIGAGHPARCQTPRRSSTRADPRAARG